MSIKETHYLDYTILLCRKMKETKAFHKVSHLSRPWKLGELQGGRHSADAAAEGSRAGLGRRPLGIRSAAIQLAFRVPPSAVDACDAELVAKGVTIVRGPADLPEWRHRTLFFRDPEDNVIEIYAEYWRSTHREGLARVLEPSDHGQGGEHRPTDTPPPPVSGLRIFAWRMARRCRRW